MDVAADEDHLRVWDLEGGQITAIPLTGRVSGLAMLPDGGIIVGHDHGHELIHPPQLRNARIAQVM